MAKNHRRHELWSIFFIGWTFLLFLPLEEAFVAVRLSQQPHLHRSLRAGRTVLLETSLDEKKIRLLYAWVCRAFAGEGQYNNLILGIAAIFGNLEEEGFTDPNGRQTIQGLLDRAVKKCPTDDEAPSGQAISTDDREIASLGAMGAGQWTGNYKTRPHSLLQISNLTDVDDWVRTLSRGCRRTIKRAQSQNFTVTARPIVGGSPAPHSSMAHFRCVVEHEVRLLAGGGKEGNSDGDTYSFIEALQVAISRYIGTTQMAGEIREYKNEDGQVIAIAHEVQKGNTIRGQWFYSTDEASRCYVWFHSVYDLVRRAIESSHVDVVDLGPSGSDAFTELKEKYGFRSVDDWTAVANYKGPFVYANGRGKDGTDYPAKYEKQLQYRSFW